ncbi:hypothetical protein [Leptospira wolffii]|uniref:hypothetical protein n=1 Tax=Leptospira wolffii TaxID=409998 RepID=UPI00058DF036|nr:hypothetical protein [Leptospira wolffii]
MKYFTYDWWFGEDLSNNDPAERYSAHYRLIENKLPKEIRTFVKEVNLHDSRELEIKRNEQDHSISLKLLCYRYDDAFSSDSQFELMINYFDVSEFKVLSDIVSNETIEFDVSEDDLGYDEFDMIENNSFEHRLLFSSGMELKITFGGFSYHIGREVSVED